MKKFTLSPILIMIGLVFLASSYFPQGCSGQKFFQIFGGKFWGASACMFASGWCEQTKTVLSNNPQLYSKMWGVSLENVDPKSTWTNKYKNHDPEQGPAYLGSTSVFVGFTDPWHGWQLAGNVFLCGAITIDLIPNKKEYYFNEYGQLKIKKDLNRKWYIIILKGGAQGLFRSFGGQACMWFYGFNR